jgi:hypothetical protein
VPWLAAWLTAELTADLIADCTTDGEAGSEVRGVAEAVSGTGSGVLGLAVGVGAGEAGVVVTGALPAGPGPPPPRDVPWPAWPVTTSDSGRPAARSIAVTETVQAANTATMIAAQVPQRRRSPGHDGSSRSG